MQKGSVCSVPTTLLKNHNQQSATGCTTKPWLAVLKERLPKDTHSVKIYNNFTSLPTTYDYPPLQAQLTMPLLINLRDWFCTGDETSRFDCLAPLPFQSRVLPPYLKPATDSWQQPELKALSHHLLLKHPSSAFRANCVSSCSTQLKCPLFQETNPFFHWAPIAHYHASQCLYVSVPAPP